ncbi:MAG TPA: polyribonucleotide nucleotidyltransferase [Longimicrobiales bacterium]|nr:polyribonucleotide nucleotidyltransferase [Longimicrobiales bacterium]
MKRVEREFAGRKLVVETGRMARQAQGSCMVQYGETTVICAATVQDRPTHLPFFPLTVEYREKMYAAGKFPGGFIKREGRPSETEILTARIIDRPIRPLFPDGFQNETQIVIYVASADQQNNGDMPAMFGASLALNMSKIPFRTPIAGVRVGRLNDQWVLNPTFEQLEYSDVDMIVAGTEKAILMVEGGAIEVPEDELVDALQAAHQGIKELIGIQKDILAELDVPAEMEWTPTVNVTSDIESRVDEMAVSRVQDALNIADKAQRSEALSSVREEVLAALEEEFPEEDQVTAIKEHLRSTEKKVMRQQVLESGKRIDGRGLDDIRDITAEVDVLPRVHGSALFTRGQTQALAVVTLGTSADEQRVDTVDTPAETSKSFMLHYNFPPFSTGEARPIRGTSRREVGHGNLAERAIQPLLPAYDDFPYTIRVVSDILESNGSSSMASVCGASLSLMDAGVPLKAPCAGIAMGLIKEGDDVAVLTDILGVEDALGDMDFKVAGTRDGVTSIQMDIKIEGLTVEIMKEALQRATRARMHILDIMEKTISEGRESLSEYAPRIISIQINPEKIGEVIGPKGKTIRAIQEETGAKIDIEDSGLVMISSPGGEGGERAREMIAAITEEPEVGRVYEGMVKTTTTFGAFVEILPGTEGLCHISELQEERTEKTEDVLKVGDVTKVKLLSIDEKGRLRLSRKAALAEQEG